MGVSCGDQGEGIEGLVSHFGGLDVVADGVGEEGEFGHVGCDVDVGAFHRVGGAGFVDGEVGGKAAVKGWVDEFGTLGEEHAAEHLQGCARFFHGGGYGDGLEVAAVVDGGGFDVD